MKLAPRASRLFSPTYLKNRSVYFWWCFFKIFWNGYRADHLNCDHPNDMAQCRLTLSIALQYLFQYMDLRSFCRNNLPSYLERISSSIRIDYPSNMAHCRLTHSIVSSPLLSCAGQCFITTVTRAICLAR